jgi:hypothetical protein
MFIICLFTKFRLPNSSVALVITDKLRNSENFRLPPWCSFHIVENTLPEAGCIISGPYITWRLCCCQLRSSYIRHIVSTAVGSVIHFPYRLNFGNRESFYTFWKGSLHGGSVHRKASTYIGQRNTENRGHASLPPAGFEPTIPVFERSKTMRALDFAATGAGFVTDCRKLSRSRYSLVLQCWTAGWKIGGSSPGGGW